MGWGQAEREKLKALLFFAGASGSGKTFSSLLMAKGMVKELYPELDDTSNEFWAKIGVIDSEHRRSKIYADMEKHGHYIGKFMHNEIKSPFNPDDYIKAVKEAKRHGIEVVIIDSTTHAWDFIKDYQQDLGGRYQDWREPTKIYNEFIKTLTEIDIHVIATSRSKQKHALESSETGKLSVVKLGEQPQQRDSFEYEFLLGLSFDHNHNATVTKDNTPIFEQLGEFKITPEHGSKLIKWLDKGEDLMKEVREKREKHIEKINSYRQSAEMEDFINEQEGKAKNYYGVGFEGLDPAVLEKLIRIVHAKSVELEKSQTEPDPRRLEILKQIEHYHVSYSAGLTGFIDDLVEKINKKYGKLNELDIDKLENALKMIEAKKAEIDKQVEEAKQPQDEPEEQPDDQKERYWLHQESDTPFKTEPGEEPEAGDIVEISKDQYEILTDMQEVDLNSKTLKELTDMAKEVGMKGYSKLSKEELIAAIEEVM